MRYILLVVLWMLSWSVPSAVAQVSVGIGLPGVSIGINLPVYPELEPVPESPVYYAPRVTSSNYFFYDGMYWAYQGDTWYASSWYNGPWGLVAPEVVPVYVLRVPVAYYRQPPAYFGGWQSNAPPRWGEHWGNEWEQRRSGWDRWNRSSVPARAPLPVYQRQYSGDRYPQAEQQQALRNEHYRYQSRDPMVHQQHQEPAVQPPPTRSQRGQEEAPQVRSPRQDDNYRSNARPSVQHNAPAASRSQPPAMRGANVQRSAPTKAHPQERDPAIHQTERQQPQPRRQERAVQREQRTPRLSQEHNPQHGQGASQGPGPGHGQQRDTSQGPGQGHGRQREASQGPGQGHGQQKEASQGPSQGHGQQKGHEKGREGG
jgi:hypothetical protein